MTDLIARLEAGECGREMDALVAEAVGLKRDLGDALGTMYGRPSSPPLTTSLDAAIKYMVPEGVDVEMDIWADPPGAQAHLIKGEDCLGHCSAPTAAAAVCAAGLRARAATRPAP